MDRNQHCECGCYTSSDEPTEKYHPDPPQFYGGVKLLSALFFVSLLQFSLITLISNTIRLALLG